MRSTLLFVFFIIITELAGGIGAIATTPNIPTWYAGLAKPALNPPNWVFGPVWTTLFFLMGTAAFIIYRRGGLKNVAVRTALILFTIQLLLNIAWSFLFFGNQNPGAAFVELIFFWLAILATIISFARISRKAAYLLLPYIAWVSFAGYLNWAIWQLN